MECTVRHDLEVMNSNPGQVELGVRSTSVLSCTWTKNICLSRENALHSSTALPNLFFMFINLNLFKPRETIENGSHPVFFSFQALFQASFYYTVSADASFADFLTCTSSFHDFTLQHDNWGTPPGGPFLPLPSGCPELVHDTAQLDDEGRRWNCVDVA